MRLPPSKLQLRKKAADPYRYLLLLSLRGEIWIQGCGQVSVPAMDFVRVLTTTSQTDVFADEACTTLMDAISC